MKLSRKILLAVALILLTAGVLYRSSGLQYHMWEDEVHHNDAIFKSDSMKDLRRNIKFQFQPVLEYAIRKIVWFNIFPPVNDTALRIPSAVYSVLTLLIGCYFFWKRRKAYNAVLFAMLFFAAGIEIQYAHEARHYSFVSLAGLLFIMTFLNLLGSGSNGKKYSVRLLLFYLASFLLLNAHFFSMFLVVACLLIILLKDVTKKDLLAKNIFLTLLVIGFTISINCLSLKYLLKSAPGGLSAPFSILDLPYQKAGQLFFGFLAQLSEIGTLGTAFRGIQFFPLLLTIIPLNLIINFSFKRMAFYSSVLISLYTLLLYSCYRSNYGFGERYVIFYSPILVILTIDALMTLLFSIPVLYKKFIRSRQFSPLLINKTIKATLFCCFVYFAWISLRNFPYQYESIQRSEDISKKDSIKSLALHIRQDGKKALILELSAGWEMDQWNMYLNHLYKNSSYQQFPQANAVAKFLGPGEDKNMDDFKNELFDTIYIGNVARHPFNNIQFSSTAYTFENVYFYTRIFKKNNTPMSYNDLMACFKILDPDKQVIPY